MKLRKIIVYILAGCLFTLSGCSINDSKDHISSKEDAEIQEVRVDPIQEKIKNMTLDEKIGQLIMCGIEGETLNENDKSLINDYKVGGIILFSNNIKSVSQAINLTNSIKEENSNNNNIPIFISSDEEGGSVTRMPQEFKRIPSARALGSYNENTVYKAYTVIGEEIQGLGMNMDYAPVLDIFSNSNNTVIGARAFGSNAEIVSKMGISAMKGLKDKNVISVVKHFPGHGDTGMDSHVNLPIVYKTKEELENFEFVPFKNAIENNCDAVMVSHILLKTIDPNNPASFSKIIISDILRNEMKFNGVIITDDMTMGAIEKNYSITEACVNSIKAGSDIVMVCFGYDNIKNVINEIKKCVTEYKSISEERIDESVYRILTLKEKYKIRDTKVNSTLDVNEINKKIIEILK